MTLSTVGHASGHGPMRRPLTRADAGQGKPWSEPTATQRRADATCARAIRPACVDRDTGAAFAEVQADAITELDAAVIPQAINGSTVFR